MKLTTIKCLYQLTFLFIIGIALISFYNPAFGKTFTVTNLNDTGKGSLRDAVLQANENPGYDEIEFDNSLAGSTIKLVSGEIEIKDDLSIRGPDNIEPNHPTIDASHLSRIFSLSGDTVFLALFRLDLTGGYSESGGGAIYGGSVNLYSVSVINNEISNSLSDSTGILCSGAGIYAQDISLFNSTVSNNKAHDCSGGGLSAAKIRLIRSTISGNSANLSGGIHVIDASDEVFILSTTITNNSSIQGAGGLGIDRTIVPLNLTIKNSILSDNQGQQGNYYVSSDDNSISVLNVSYSIFGDDSPEINGASKAVIFSNQPDLGPLEDNGGPTLTHLPNPTSPALDNGDTRVANTVDQRGTGFKGVVNHRIDIVSVEHQAIQAVSKIQQELNKNLAKWKQFGFDSYEFNST